jgi:hypothetical protein
MARAPGAGTPGACLTPNTVGLSVKSPDFKRRRKAQGMVETT